MNHLSLEVVTPLGVKLVENGVDRVVLRRREAEHETGSLISIYPSHAPMLVQTPEFDVAWDREGIRDAIHVGPGVAEVFGDHITLLAAFVDART